VSDQFYGATNIHPIGAIALIIAVVAVLTSRRELIPVVFISILAAFPAAQRMVVGSLDFNFVRILVLAILARAWARGEHRSLVWLKVDTTLVMWAVWAVLAYGWLYDSLAALVTRSGYMIECIGAYLAARIYIRNTDDVIRVGRALGTLSIPMLAFFFFERQTGRNPFSVFGGVPEYTLVREGRMRCQGPFSHPIMAGVFWAYAFIYLVGLARAKLLPMARTMPGIVCSLLIVANTASSTPAMAVVFALFGFFLYRFRHLLRHMLWALAGGLAFAHLMMNKPVWHLIARVNIFSGSTGWHRYHLIDQAVARFDEWFLVGTVSTAHWGAGLLDVTNQFVLEGVRAGFLGLVLFVTFYIRCFNLIGTGIKTAGSESQRQIAWAMGVIVFVTVGNFLAVSYFGQVVGALHFFLGMAVAIAFSIAGSGKTGSVR
jgi:hypothetical protein